MPGSIVMLIPAYKPDEKMIALAEKLTEAGLPILIVDDGSGEEFLPVFEEAIRRNPDMVKVYHSPQNEGKGSALKHGMSELLNFYPECTHFITADADGQHTVPDILKVRDAMEAGSSMVLTTRSLKGNIPTTSRMGNMLSRWVYTIATGHYFCDNQSGLRGFAKEHIAWLTKVAGNRYDYELNFLYYADKQHIKIDTVEIETVYIDDNKSSHFDPLRDTLRIYRSLFTSARSALISSALFMIAMIVVTIINGYENCFILVPGIALVCTALCIVLENLVFCNVKYKDSTFVFWSRVLRGGIYTGLAVLLSNVLPVFPLAVMVVLTGILLMFIRYNFYKLFRKARN